MASVPSGGSGGGGAAATSGGAAAAAPAEEEKEEEKEEGMSTNGNISVDSTNLILEKEESDEDMGFGLFD